MRRARLGLLLPAVLALVASACTPAVATQMPPGPSATPSVAPASISQASSAPTATLVPSVAATSPQKPPAPSNFNVTEHKEQIVCPSPDTDNNCHMSDLAWQSTAAAGTWFKIYESWTGEGGATCPDAQVDESVIITTKPDARAAQVYDAIATGGGGRCLWVSAVNNVGESEQVPAMGQ